MAASGGFAEPQVLAHAKRRLFPGDGESYAVADTQFASAEWRPGERVESWVHETLAPFNHVDVGGGYPDLVGVERLDADLVSVERVGTPGTAEPPLIAVEAKGFAGGGVDARTGIGQAHDRLGEANVAYVALPATAISESDRALARECNVGVLAVEADGAVTAVERPRVVGNRTTDAATAIRFQASAQGVANQSFSLNHPKNYLGYPLAHYCDRATDQAVDGHVVGEVDGARQGAAFLGLIDEQPDGVALTGLGREVVRFALARYDGSIDAALREFGGWQGTRKRFYDEAPLWGELARRVVYAYPATELLVTELQALHDDGFREPSLVALVEWMHVQHPSFTVELFLRGDEGVRERVLTADGELRTGELNDGEVYHSPTVFQLKAMLYHAGIVTERGAEPHRLDPSTDVWALCESVAGRRGP